MNEPGSPAPGGPGPPFWPPGPPPNGNRRLIRLLLGLVCVLTAIVVVLTVAAIRGERQERPQSSPTSSPAASPDRTPAPVSASDRPVPVAALDGLLPDKNVVSSAVDDPAIDLVTHGEYIDPGDLADADCQGITSVSSQAYAGSGWTAIRWQRWNSPADPDPRYLAKHVSMSVTSFPHAAAARAFYARQSAAWRKCNVRIVNSRLASANESPDQLWFIDNFIDSDGVLQALMMDNVNSDWTCETRLTVRSNVVVRVSVCESTTTSIAARTTPSTVAARTLLGAITSKVDAAG
ncbi:hypothetical protein MTER_08240 [Mycolicibacter terrae]|uniref:PknH-like extracellular domain-containing protein n=1 Tax=Mycolicibacter terrae TaxID=1788 RepID=A0AAD1HTY1_9MYCO|nr:sensor domain-containing protein [Mycolicibacter terrae]BBX21413.1 hypothetical protein MTER_08240 [Mycolicibacter terrae]SNV89119.1 conserved lipoprotein LppH [Mycolicibacter terrae]